MLDRILSAHVFYVESLDVIRARLVEALKIEGGSNTGPNILAVPENDSRSEEIRTLEDVPQQGLREIEQLFVAFKRLERYEETEVRSCHSLKETHKMICESSR